MPERIAALPRGLQDALDPLRRGALEDSRQQPLLVSEVVVDRGLGDSRPLRQLIDAGAGIAAAGKQLGGGF